MNFIIKSSQKSHFCGGFRIKAPLFSGLVILLFGLAFFGFAKYYDYKQRREFRGTIQELAFIDGAKSFAARAERYTNGFQITLKDMRGYLTDLHAELLAPYMAEEGPDGKLIYSGGMGLVYILNPVGVPAKVRFLHELAGHPAGSEITASLAKIMTDLEQINFAKNKIARACNWDRGHLVTLNDIKNMPGGVHDYQGSVLFVPNPVGVPVTARVVSAWQGLPAGLVVSSDY